MRIRPSTLFALFPFFVLIFGYLNKSKTLDIQLHDFYFVLNYFIISLLIAFWSIINGIIFYVAEKNNVLSSYLKGYWSFGFYFFGLLLFAIVSYLPFKGYSEFNETISKDFFHNKILLIGFLAFLSLLLNVLIAVFISMKVMYSMFKSKIFVRSRDLM